MTIQVNTALFKSIGALINQTGPANTQATLAQLQQEIQTASEQLENLPELKIIQEIDFEQVEKHTEDLQSLNIFDLRTELHTIQNSLCNLEERISKLAQLEKWQVDCIERLNQALFNEYQEYEGKCVLDKLIETLFDTCDGRLVIDILYDSVRS